ncbi:MAG: DnaJ C-terminal domain-containing protein [Burkholderiales bacterium]
MGCRDVDQSVRLAPWEAALGAKIEVPTPPTGAVDAAAPPGWKKGKKLRLKGRGIPGRAAGDAGDMYVELELALPPGDNPSAREIHETMKCEMAVFHPRAGDRSR